MDLIYVAFRVANIDMESYSDDQIDSYLLSKGLLEIRESKRRFHKDFLPYNEKIYAKYFTNLKNLVERGELESLFYHFVRSGYHEIITDRRRWFSFDDDIFDTVTRQVLIKNLYPSWI